MRKCLCSQVCESCRAREALLRWWWPAKPNLSEPELWYSSRSGHADNEHWEKYTEQCEHINCILKCVFEECVYSSPQFLLLSPEAPSSAHWAVWLWMQELLAAINTVTENPLNMQCFKFFFTQEQQIFTLKIPPFCQAIFSMVSPRMLVWSIPNEEMPHTQGRLRKTFE